MEPAGRLGQLCPPARVAASAGALSAHPTGGRRRGGGCARRRRRRESGLGCSRRPVLALRRARRRLRSGAASPRPSPRRPARSPLRGLAAGTRSGGTASHRRDGGRTRAARAGSGPAAKESPVGPGPRPVPSPAGSPGQHHGRRPGSPSPPGRGLLDPKAPSRLAQGLLRLRVQAPSSAGSGGPGPRALGLAPHGAHSVPHGVQEQQDRQRAGCRRPPGLQAPGGEEDHDEPRNRHRGLPRHHGGERLLPVVHIQLRLPQLLLPGLHRPGLLPQGPGQEAAQRPERGGGGRQDGPAIQHHELRAGRLLHHLGLHLPAVPAHRLLRPRQARRRDTRP